MGCIKSLIIGNNKPKSIPIHWKGFYSNHGKRLRKNIFLGNINVIHKIKNSGIQLLFRLTILCSHGVSQMMGFIYFHNALS